MKALQAKQKKKSLNIVVHTKRADSESEHCKCGSSGSRSSGEGRAAGKCTRLAQVHDEVSESEANRDATSYWWFREYREFDYKFIDYGMSKKNRGSARNAPENCT